VFTESTLTLPALATRLLYLALIIGKAGVKNDLHVYDPASLTWFDLSSVALGTPPSARSGHGFTPAGGKLYVHGGVGNNGMHQLR
jgi:hypothetical protein